MASVKIGSLDAHAMGFSIGAVDTDTSFDHSLGRTPVEAFVVRKSSNANVYRGSVAWTSTTINLRASAGVSGRVYIF